jgi:hypothetical protein
MYFIKDYKSLFSPFQNLPNIYFITLEKKEIAGKSNSLSEKEVYIYNRILRNGERSYTQIFKIRNGRKEIFIHF